MRATTLNTSKNLLVVIAVVTLLAGVASAQTAIGFTTPPPNTVASTFEGCRNDGTILLPNGSGKFICPDAAYTTGSLGKGWNELDLVPFRLILGEKSSGTGTPYNLIIAADYISGGNLGYDVISLPVVNAGESTGTCSVADASGGQQDVTGVTGGTDQTIYRTLTITQSAGSSCVFDYYQRLAIGSHLYPGDSLQAYIFGSADFKTGKSTISIPVKQITPQSLSKTMTATQNSDHTWTVSKSAPSSLTFPDICSNTSPLTNVQITVQWTKAKSPSNGPITITTMITATNPASRPITATVTDQIYLGLTQTAPLDLFTSPATVIPAMSSVTFTHTYVDGANETATSYNDVATGSYTDTVTGIPIPETTTATACVGGSSCKAPNGTTPNPIQVGVNENATALIKDVENITGNFEFAVTAVTDASGGTFADGYTLNSYTAGPAEYDTGTLSSSSVDTDSGTIMFTKSVSYNGTGPAAGSLSDTATLQAYNSDGSLGMTTGSGAQTVGVSAEASVKLTISKAVTPSATQAFTFNVLNSASQPAGSPIISFTAGGATTLTTTLSNLVPDSYSVTETPVTGWTTDTSTHSVPLTATSAATCAATTNFSNSEEGHIIVQKVTVPASDTTTEFTFTPSGYGSPFQLTNGGTPNDSGVLGPGNYSVSESSIPSGWDLTNLSCSITNPGSGTSTSNISGPSASITLGAGDTVTCVYTNTQRGSLVVVKNTVGGDGTFNFTGGGTGVPTSISIKTTGNTGTYPTITGLTPGSGYSVAETVPSGWNLTSSLCDNGSPLTAITITAGQTTTCTFTDTQQGSLVVVKNTVGGDGTFNFTGGGTGVPASISITTIGNTGSNPAITGLVPGSGYSVAETVPSGWNLTNSVCDNGSPLTAISIVAGKTTTCTFTDTQQGSLIIKKVTVGGDGTFNFTGGGTGVPASISITTTGNAGAYPTITGLVPGSGYSVAETVPSGWNLTNSVCDNGSPLTSISIVAGKTTTCTFTDTQQGSLIIKKVTVGGDGTFNFTGGGTGVPASISITTTGNAGAYPTITGLVPGSGYSVAETVPSGWNLTNSVCSNGTPSAITIVAGQTTTCTFTNTQQGSLVVVKNTVGGNGTFNFTGGGTGVPPSISITTIGNTGSNPAITGLLPGSGYSVAETVPSGWNLTNSVCSKGTPSAITIVAGQTTTCTFTNTQQGTLIVKKVTNPSPDTTNTSFSFSAGGGLSPTSFSLKNGGTPETYSNLIPKSGYSVSETVPTGWTQTSASCDNGGAVGSITVGAGQTVTCTFTNSTAFAKVTKTFNGGPIPAGACGTGSNTISPCAFTFQLRSGASATVAGNILESETFNSTTPAGTITFKTLLVPGQQYEMCEQLAPGWMTTLGPPLYSVYNPSGDNSVVCANFTPTAGQTVSFALNNTPPPGGLGLTIGYWKNWASCTGGHQSPTLDKVLYASDPTGISVGTVTLFGGTTANSSPYCAEAVDILNKSTLKGAKESSNPFYNLAAQLLGAELNQAAGAGVSTCAATDINSAQALLVAVGFNDSTVPKGTSSQQTTANNLQTQLNNYNNNQPASCITYP